MILETSLFRVLWEKKWDNSGKRMEGDWMEERINKHFCIERVNIIVIRTFTITVIETVFFNGYFSWIWLGPLDGLLTVH